LAAIYGMLWQEISSSTVRTKMNSSHSAMCKTMHTHIPHCLSEIQVKKCMISYNIRPISSTTSIQAMMTMEAP